MLLVTTQAITGPTNLPIRARRPAIMCSRIGSLPVTRARSVSCTTNPVAAVAACPRDRHGKVLGEGRVTD